MFRTLLAKTWNYTRGKGEEASDIKFRISIIQTAVLRTPTLPHKKSFANIYDNKKKTRIREC